SALFDVHDIEFDKLEQLPEMTDKAIFVHVYRGDARWKDWVKLVNEIGSTGVFLNLPADDEETHEKVTERFKIKDFPAVVLMGAPKKNNVTVFPASKSHLQILEEFRTNLKQTVVATVNRFTFDKFVERTLKNKKFGVVYCH